MPAAAKRLLSSSSKAAASLPTAVIPKLNRSVTRIGFGAYRVSDKSHGQALRAAIQAGVNIVDTASNFENGMSEEIIGDTVQDMVSSGQVQRQDLTVITKSGYLTPADIQSLDANDYVQINDKSYHGISPRVLERQIATSLERLKMNRIDIFMLNAPERMLMGKNRRYTSSQLYAEMSESFRYLDSLVADGTIGGYGVCSNTMALGSAADHVSFPDIRSACSNPSNFVAIEAPFNVFERDALISGASPGLSLPTIAQYAEENGIYFMTNRPLNAIANGQIRVLVNHALGNDKEGSTASEQQWIEQLSRSFEKVSRLEADMMSELPAEEENLAAKFVWGQVLSENLARLAQNHFAARHYLTRQVLPAVEKDVQALKQYAADLGNEDKEAAFDQWISDYRESVQTLSHDMVNYAYIDTLRKNSELDRVLNALSPTLGKQSDEGIYSPLSVKALRILLANKQIGTVFTGMRQPAYVRDAVYAAQESAQHPIRAEELEDIWQCPIFY